MPVLKNARHERFAQFVAQGKTLTEAYELAGFKGDRGNAVHLRDRQEVAQRIQQLTAQTAKRTEITAEYLTNELQELATEARQRGQLSAAVSAIDKMAKINGFGLDRAQVNIENHAAPDAESLRKAMLEHVLASKAEDSDGSTLQ